MGTIKEEAMAYEPPQTKNIADLDEVNIIDFELLDGEGTDSEGNTFKYKCAKINDELYRIPGKVLGDIKAILKIKPGVTKVSVTKSGSGKTGTSYTVIPLD